MVNENNPNETSLFKSFAIVFGIAGAFSVALGLGAFWGEKDLAVVGLGTFALILSGIAIFEVILQHRKKYGLKI